MSFLRVLPFLLLALAVGVAGFAVGALTDPFGDVRRRVAGELSPEAPRLADQLARAKAEASDLAQQLEQVRGAREELRRELEAARAGMERLRAQAGDAKDARDAARDRYQELRTRTERLSARVEDLQGRLNQLRERLADTGADEPGDDVANAAAAAAEGTEASGARDLDTRGSADGGEAAEEAGSDTGEAGDGTEGDGGEELQGVQEPAEARPSASALRAIDPTPAQDDRRVAGVEAYTAGDYERAYRLWLPLAQAGYARAQLHVGALFLEGRGVPRDDVLAHVWLTLADQNGSRNASGLLERLDARMTAAERRAANDLLARATPSR